MEQLVEALRLQQTMIDMVHQLLIAALAGVCLWLCIKTYTSKDGWYALWVPAFIVGIEGLIMRVETQVQRFGGFFLRQGDLWEIAKAAHTPTGNLMPFADALTLVPLLIMLIYAYLEAWDYFWTQPWRRAIYFFVSLAMIIIGIYGISQAITTARTGF